MPCKNAQVFHLHLNSNCILTTISQKLHTALHLCCSYWLSCAKQLNEPWIERAVHVKNYINHLSNPCMHELWAI